jgi:hypothetical protein
MYPSSPKEHTCVNTFPQESKLTRERIIFILKYTKYKKWRGFKMERILFGPKGFTLKSPPGRGPKRKLSIFVL